MSRRISRNNNYSSGTDPSGFFYGIVTAVSGSFLSVQIPKLGLDNVYENVPFSGFTPSVGDNVWVSFIEGRSNTPIAFVGASDTSSDITEIIAGTNLNGGGTGGSISLNVDDEITIDGLTFNTAAAVVVSTEGQMAWNDDEGTVDIGLHSAASVLQIGQEVLYYVKNQSGATIPNGSVVRFDGALGASGRLKVVPFLADGSYPSSYVMGVTTMDIPNGEDGYVTHFGKVRSIDTATPGWAEGQVLYASPTAAGGFTTIAPSAPNNIVQLAAVVNVHPQNGVLFVRPSVAGNILDNEGIIYTGLSDNDTLVYDSAQGVFVNLPFDHGNLAGLSDDDHTQYLLVDGTRSADALTVTGTLTANLTGNADTATTLATGRTISIDGGISVAVPPTFDGSGNITITAIVNNDSHTHDTRYFTETESDARYVLKNTSYEWTSGQLTFRSNDVLESTSGDQATLEVYQDTAGADAFMQFHVAGDYAAYFGLKGDINDFAVGGWSMGGNYYRVWHAGNDGSGSGLDADLLDGNHSSAFAAASHTHSYISTSSTQTSNLYIRNTSPTVYFRDTDHRSAMIHVNSNLFYVLRGSGTDSTSWSQVNGRWPLVINLENNNMEVGGEAHCWQWWRSFDNTGWYNQTHGGGIYMTGSTWVEVYNGKGLLWSGTGIGGPLPATTTTSGYRYVMQNTTFLGFAQYTSRRDLKDSIAPLSDTFDSGAIIDALRPVTFISKYVPPLHEPDALETPEHKAWRLADTQIGFIADEVAAACPELASYDTEDGELVPGAWKWEATIALLVDEVKSLRARIAALEQG